VIFSPVFRRAIAAEMAALARQTATVGASLAALPPAARPVTNANRARFEHACASLRQLHTAIDTVHQREPVLAEDRDLLRAVPIAITRRAASPT
jgi:hypothetical protein